MYWYGRLRKALSLLPPLREVKKNSRSGFKWNPPKADGMRNPTINYAPHVGFFPALGGSEPDLLNTKKKYLAIVV